MRVRVNRRGGSRRPRRARSRGTARPPRPCGPRARRGAPRRSAGARRAAPAVRPCGALVDQPEPELDVTEQPALVGRRVNAGPAAELEHAADVVDERRGEQQVGSQPRMQLRGLAAERRHADRVLEQPARVGVVVVRRRRVRARGRDRRARPAPSRSGPGCDDVRDEELEEAGELVGVAAEPSASATPGSTSAVSSERTSSCRRSRKRSTRPSTRTASPSPKRPSSSSTSLQTRASIFPVGSTSSSARYEAPPRVRSFRFVLTA